MNSPIAKAVALGDLAELFLADVVGIEPRLVVECDFEAVVRRVEVRARPFEDRPLTRAVSVVGVFVGRQHGVGSGFGHVLGIERHRDHPDRSRRVAEADVGINPDGRARATLDHEAVTAEIPDGDGLGVGIVDGVRKPVAPVADCHGR